MKSAGVPFEEVQLDTDAAALAELKERRNLDTINTPSLEYGGKFYDMTTFRELLDTVASDRELAIA